MDDKTARRRELVALADLAQRRALSRFGNVAPIAPNPHESKWFCAQTNPGQEQLAAGGFQERYFPIYLPTILARERHGHSAATFYRERERPMYPGYLFVKCKPDADHFERSRNVRGFVRFLGDEGGPRWIPEGAVDAIRLDEALRDTREGKKKRRWPFTPGDVVRVTTGPFCGFFAKINSAVDDRGRIMALVEVFSRSTPTLIHADCVEKL